MKFKTLIATMLVLAFAAASYAITKTFEQRDVRNPRTLEVVLEEFVQGGYVVSDTNATQTVSFTQAFYDTNSVIVCTYTEDPGDVRPIWVTDVTTTNFVAHVTADKNFAWFATGNQ